MTVERAARSAARSIRRTPAAVAKAAGVELKRELERLAGREVGPDLRMSNLRRVRVGAKVTVFRWGNGARADVEPSTPRARSPWRWLTDGTRPHEVPRKNRRRGRGGPLVTRMKTPRGWRTGPWRVSGVSGKGLWWRAGSSAGPNREALRAFNEEMRRGQ